MEGFEYVVNPKKVPKVAFGTTMHREVMPTSGPFMDSYMRSEQGEVRPIPGPFEYNIKSGVGFKYPSNAGFSAFISKVPRLLKQQDLGIPPLGNYAPERWRATDRSGYTFNKAQRSEDPTWVTPGPSTYTFHMLYPKWNIDMAFYSRRVIWPAVAVFCAPFNSSKCMECHKQPYGDYFHNFTTHQDLCRKCLHTKLVAIRDCNLQVVERCIKRREIKQFVPARYCGFFHDHNGTNAALELTTRKQLRDKIRVENYLYLYNEKQEH